MQKYFGGDTEVQGTSIPLVLNGDTEGYRVGKIETKSQSYCYNKVKEDKGKGKGEGKHDGEWLKQHVLIVNQVRLKAQL